MKQERNTPCACGSGKKFKNCCLKSQKPSARPRKIIIRSPEYIEGMARSCRLARKTLEFLEPLVAPGVTTNYINDKAHEFMLDHKATPATLNYGGFPKSICASINEVICHGIPNECPLQEGDILNIDVTCILDGYHGDTNKTFEVGECSPQAKKIIAVTRTCLQKGIEATHPYGHLGDIGAAIQKHAHSEGYSVVEDFVGHGIGLKFHESPQVRHFGKPRTGEVILPGMFFTIEPMINAGVKNSKILADEWTAVTADGKLSAQFEHTLMITDTGIRILTLESDDLPLV